MKTGFNKAELKQLRALSLAIEAQRDNLRGVVATLQERLDAEWENLHRAEVAAIEYLNEVIAEEENDGTVDGPAHRQSEDDELADAHLEFLDGLRTAVEALETDINFSIEAELDEAFADAGADQTLCELLDISEE